MSRATSTQSVSVQSLSYVQALVQAQIEEMTRDERVILMGEDLSIYGDGKVLETFGRMRAWNTPISENSFVGLAIGAAMTGMRPVVTLGIASFMYLACDQIINQAAKLHYMTGGQMKVPAVFRCALYYNKSIAAQHSDRCHPMFMNVPGLKILVPASPADAKGLLKSAIRDDDPVLVFEDSALWGTKEDVSTDADYLVPIGTARVRKAGSDVTVVAIAGCMKPALAAAKELEDERISVEVIDPRTLVPLDKETIIRSVAKTRRLIVMDNAHRTCNAAAEIAATVAEEAFESLCKPILRLSPPDVHIPYSPVLERSLFPDKDRVIASIKALL
jgi:acetoin:2,6-dichlorophenolindophenol oxidoreductase subunit beta